MFCLSFKSTKSCLIIRLMVLCEISIYRAMIFSFRAGFWLILDQSALIAFDVRPTRGRPDLFWSLTPSVSKNYQTVRYTKILVLFNDFSYSKIRALSVPHLWRAMTAIRFSLSLLFILWEFNFTRKFWCDYSVHVNSQLCKNNF